MTSFGEIVEPGSRNAWEDWDDNLQNQANTVLQWKKEFITPENIKTFLILEGRYLGDSLNIHGEVKLEQVNTVHEVNLKLYRIEEIESYVCIIKDYNLLQSTEIIELLKNYIILAQDVVSIVTKPLVEYQIQELSSIAYVLRTLSTSKAVSKSLGITYPRLEQPNIISGVSAGVISLRESMNLPAVAVVCYMEEECQMLEVQQLLEKLKIAPIKANNLLNTNLYI